MLDKKATKTGARTANICWQPGVVQYGLLPCRPDTPVPGLHRHAYLFLVPLTFQVSVNSSLLMRARKMLSTLLAAMLWRAAATDALDTSVATTYSTDTAEPRTHMLSVLLDTPSHQHKVCAQSMRLRYALIPCNHCIASGLQCPGTACTCGLNTCWQGCPFSLLVQHSVQHNPHLLEVLCEGDRKVPVTTVQLQQVPCAALCYIHSPAEHVLAHATIGLGECSFNLRRESSMHRRWRHCSRHLHAHTPGRSKQRCRCARAVCGDLSILFLQTLAASHCNFFA